MIPLHHLVCKSQTDSLLSVPELAMLWTTGRTYSVRDAITGLLIYLPDGHYLHVLEGPQEALQVLLTEPGLGPLQPTDCAIIGQGPWARRSFPAWSISFQADESPAGVLPDFVPLSFLVTLMPRLAANRPALVYRVLEFIAPYVAAYPAAVHGAG